MGVTGLLARRSSTCCGSSGRPGCSNITGRLCSNMTGGGGGAFRVMSGGGTDRAAAARGGGGVLSTGGGTDLLVLSVGGMFLSVGAACRFGAGPVLLAPVVVEPGAALLAGVKRRARAGGAGTGLPGKAAWRVGFTGGCGTICALASREGFIWATCGATGCPLLKTFFGTAVVAIL